MKTILLFLAIAAALASCTNGEEPPEPSPKKVEKLMQKYKLTSQKSTDTLPKAVRLDLDARARLNLNAKR